MEPLIKRGAEEIKVELGLPIMSDYESFVNVNELLKIKKMQQKNPNTNKYSS